MSVSLEFFPPSPALSGLVAFHYVFETTQPYGAVLNAMLPQAQWRLHGQFFYTFGDGQSYANPAANLVGATNSATTISALGPARVVGCGFLPAGWAALVRESALALADRCTDAQGCWGAAGTRLLERLAQTPSSADCASLIDQFLTSRLNAVEGTLATRIRAIDSWLVHSNLALDSLTQGLGLSARQAGRIAGEVYGASPKLLASKYRALRSAARFATGDARHWSDAIDEGYCDQPHFIHSFQRFVGSTPAKFAKEDAALAHAAMRGRWQAGARHPLGLWS